MPSRGGQAALDLSGLEGTLAQRGGTDDASFLAVPPRLAAAAAGAEDASAVGEGRAAEALGAFLATSPAEGQPQVPSSFTQQLKITFSPKAAELTAQELQCEDDIAICNRECERLFGSMPEQMEEPCKLAVASHFAGGAACFPASASVLERRRGKVAISDVKVGDELVALPGGAAARVVALLHEKQGGVELYLRVRHEGGELAISPQHLLRARRPASDWAWLPAEDVRPGDELLDARGSESTVREVCRAGLRGAHAPLTTTGTLLVDGVLCSCYAPPASWALPHEACHAALMPLRLLSSLRAAAERWSRPKGGKEPLLTVEAIWLLPRLDDESLHPYASGLLRTVHAAKAAAAHLRSLLP